MAAHGVKKSHLIETAVLHHLSALDSIPADLIIPPVIEVSRATGTPFWIASQNQNQRRQQCERNSMIEMRALRADDIRSGFHSGDVGVLESTGG